ncbi:MAG: hypothetical protein J3Q66DRAFT_323223 [Benniella sp.]|nr:MAG: hypothetical protein J3Q66DRAFT_323223 [Benniella sp.]
MHRNKDLLAHPLERASSPASPRPPSFLQSPSHSRSHSASSDSIRSTCLQKSLSHSFKSTRDHPSTSPSSSSTPMAKASKHHSNTRFSNSSTPPVYQCKKISQRYSSSPASSYTEYSSALAASYHNHQQQLYLHQHTRSHSSNTHSTTNYSNTNNPCSTLTNDSRSDPASHRPRNGSNDSNSINNNTQTKVLDDTKTKNAMCGNCACNNSSNRSHRFNSPPSPCLSTLDSACPAGLIAHDSSALPSPSLSESSTDSIFSSEGSTSMAHCSPILPNAMATLLHEIPSPDSSMASSPILSYCSSPRPLTTDSSSASSSPSPSPPPSAARSRRTSSLASRSSQASAVSQLSGYFSQHGSRPTTPVMTSGAAVRKRSTGAQSSSSPRLSSLRRSGGVSKSGSVVVASLSSPQEVVQDSIWYIRFLLLPLIPLLLLALGAQTSANFESPAKYV